MDVVWRNILKGWKTFKNILLRYGLGIKLVFGAKSGVVLKDDFLVLYKASCQRELFVQQVRGTEWDFGI